MRNSSFKEKSYSEKLDSAKRAQERAKKAKRLKVRKSTKLRATGQGRPLKRKPKSRSRLVKDLDAVFSKYIRNKYAKDGLVACYTCGKIGEVAHLQNGHFVSRSVRNLRWHEDNCRPQCFGCNIMQGGQTITFRENLVKEIGETGVQFLEKSRFVTFKPTREWFEEKIAHYTELLANL